MNLILIFPDEATPDNRVHLTNGRAEHIRKVLRAEPGKTLQNIKGGVGIVIDDFLAALLALACNHIAVRIVSEFE